MYSTTRFYKFKYITDGRRTCPALASDTTLSTGWDPWPFFASAPLAVETGPLDPFPLLFDRLELGDGLEIPRSASRSLDLD